MADSTPLIVSGCFGYYSSAGGLTLNRRVELLPGNLYRWVDTFTNGGSTSLTTSVSFSGNLGSDSSTVFSTVNLYFQVSSDALTGAGSDPIVGFIWGNNPFAASFTRTQAVDQTTITIPLTLAPGQSQSLMYFSFLALELVNRDITTGIALTTSTMNALFASPNVTGLSAAEQASIVNWGAVPEPGTYLTFGSGLAALLWLRRRKL